MSLPEADMIGTFVKGAATVNIVALKKKVVEVFPKYCINDKGQQVSFAKCLIFFVSIVKV